MGIILKYLNLVADDRQEKNGAENGNPVFYQQLAV
jgi:hypothetical protein